MDQQNQQIKRVLALCDFACATGFAQIAEHVIAAVAQTNRYQIDIVGINYFGMPTQWQQAYPTVRVFPAHFTSQGDVFGRRGFMQMLSSGQYDLAWILQDTFNIEPIAQSINDLRNEMAANGKKTFKWVFYYPIDAAPKENWITKSVSLADYPVAYTKYGYTESVKYDKALEDRLRVIPHGIDLEDFKPLPEKDVKEFRHSYFNGLADDKFLVVNVNRNQPRKDIPSTMQAFKLLKQQVPNALLYLHMKKFDAGWNLDELARNYELAPELDWIAPENFDEHEGLPVQVVNALYNAADVVMTTTYGEGWGLSLTEAMAVGKIVVAPDQTSCHEIVEGHGILVPAGRGVSDWVVLSNDNERLRPKVSIPHMVDALTKVAQSPQQFEEVRQAGHEYAKTLDWQLIGQEWVKLFDEASKSQVKKTVVGRNDPCPCGSGKKFKHCHGKS